MKNVSPSCMMTAVRKQSRENKSDKNRTSTVRGQKRWGDNYPFADR